MQFAPGCNQCDAPGNSAAGREQGWDSGRGWSTKPRHQPVDTGTTWICPPTEDKRSPLPYSSIVSPLPFPPDASPVTRLPLEHPSFVSAPVNAPPPLSFSVCRTTGSVPNYDSIYSSLYAPLPHILPFFFVLLSRLMHSYRKLQVKMFRRWLSALLTYLWLLSFFFLFTARESLARAR